MHLLETQPQRIWLDETYPNGGVEFLRDIGFLSPRLTLAHCVWARDAELNIELTPLFRPGASGRDGRGGC